ncbi:MAG: hypothetical protein SF339_10675 [Blastocatellia bacterium]|nr:hypothetical protein [Blastocatellia bacterium]
MKEEHPATTRFAALLSGSAILVLLAGALFVAAAITTLFTDEIVSLAINVYSRRGAVTSIGNEMIHRVVGRARGMFLLGGVGCFTLALLFRAAERAMRPHQAIAANAPPWEPATEKRLLWLMAGLIALRVVVNQVHLHDSLWCDELYSWQSFARGPLAGIFGVSKTNLPNNHILNSLLMKLSLFFGLNTEAGLRLWNYLASLLTIPAAWHLGRVFRLREGATALLMLLVAASPVIERYGTQARGYGLAILLAMLSVALHVSLFDAAGRGSRRALLVVNVLLVLANIYTVTLVLGEILHLLLEGLHPRSASRREGHPAYRHHLRSLLLSLLVSLGLNLLLIPFIILNSIVFASKEPFSAAAFFRAMSGMLTPDGNLWMGAAVILLLCWMGIGCRGRGADRGFWALLSVIVCGILAGVFMHLYELRAVAYLNGLALLMIVATLTRSLSHRAIGASMAVLALAFSAYGVAGSLRRPPIQDYRGMIAEAERLSNGRMIWTSGFASAGVEYYRPMATPEQMPPGPSVYLSFFDWEVKNDPLQRAVWNACRLRQAYPSELKMAIYECP